MDVRISGDAEQFIREEVANGRLDRLIEEGLAQLDRGEGISGQEALDALREKGRRRREAR